MLGKLLKYELKSTSRIFLPLFLITAIMAVLTRIFRSIGFLQTGYLTFIPGMFTALFILILVGTGFAAFIISIYRFYKNYITDEGYLMFTLPVTVSQLIWSKLIVSIMWMLVSFLVIVGAFSIVFYGTTIWTMVVELLVFMKTDLSIAAGDDSTFIVASLIIYMVISLIYNMLFIYLSIALGQMIIKKHKILGSIGAYFALSTLTQLVTTIIMVIYLLITGNLSTTMDTFPSSLFVFFTVVMIIFSGMVFYGTDYVLKNKLNLD